MKKIFLKKSVISILSLTLFISCRTQLPPEPYTQEETGMGIARITDENISVETGSSSSYKGVAVPTCRLFSISPKGDYFAFISRVNEKSVACIRRTGDTGSQLTQRTFRSTSSLSWGSDGKIYFSDNSDGTNNQYISSVNALAGSIIKQYSSGNDDCNPILSKDGKKLFFERASIGKTPYIWCYDISTASLLQCCEGSCPYPIDKNGNKLLLSRKHGETYAIWIVDYEKGEESMLLSSEEQNFVQPTLSPNGEWILLTSNVYSPTSKQQQLDIYCVKKDGSNLTKLTSHPADDQCPIWSADGKYIYFISNRASKKNGIWRMNFTL